MRILWGALRAVSVETMGVLVVLWMVHGATGLAIDTPWSSTRSAVAANQPRDPANTPMVRPVPVATTTRIALASNDVDQRDVDQRVVDQDDVDQRDAGQDEVTHDETQRATVRQWFNTLFPARVNAARVNAARVNTAPEKIDTERRAEYARERLDHFSRLYGIASRD